MDPGIAMESTIILIGQTGAGKSQFIRAAAGIPSNDPRPPHVGHDLTSKTKKVEAFRAINPRFPKKSVRLIDTPGFNDSEGTGDDKEIKKIIQWLKEEPHAIIKGILYLHEITQIRSLHTDTVRPENIPQPPGSFVVTTKWPKTPRQAEEVRREQGLQEVLGLPPGSMYRFDNTSISAWKIIAAVEALPANVTRQKLAEDLEILCPHFRAKQQDGSLMKRLAKFFRKMFN